MSSNDTTIPDGFKRCTRCKEIKATSEFNKNPTAKSGLRSYCRACTKATGTVYRDNPERKKRAMEAGKAWALAHPERVKRAAHESYLRHKDKVTDRSRIWRENNREKYNALQRARRLRNPELYNEKSREYRRNNPEKSAAASRNWERNNPDKLKAQRRRYYTNNKERVFQVARESKRRRKARKHKLATANITYLTQVLYFIQEFQCLYCEVGLFHGHQLDHILPIIAGDALKQHPGHTPPNLALTCIHCNSSKQSALLEDWLSRKYPAAMDTILHRVEYHIAIMTTLYELCGEDNRKWQQILDELERGLSIEEILG